MKIINITGRIGKDAVLRRTQNGDAVLGFTVAVDEGYGQNKSTIWFDASIWGKRGESLEQYLRKGTKITASGEFSMREHEGKNYPTIRVDHIDFDVPKREERKPEQSMYSDNRANSLSDALSDDIPF